MSLIVFPGNNATISIYARTSMEFGAPEATLNPLGMLVSEPSFSFSESEACAVLRTRNTNSEYVTPHALHVMLQKFNLDSEHQ